MTLLLHLALAASLTTLTVAALAALPWSDADQDQLDSAARALTVLPGRATRAVQAVRVHTTAAAPSPEAAHA